MISPLWLRIEACDVNWLAGGFVIRVHPGYDAGRIVTLSRSRSRDSPSCHAESPRHEWTDISHLTSATAFRSPCKGVGVPPPRYYLVDGMVSLCNLAHKLDLLQEDDDHRYRAYFDRLRAGLGLALPVCVCRVRFLKASRTLARHAARSRPRAGYFDPSDAMQLA